MASEFSDKNHRQPESALAGISESILLGLTKPIETLSQKTDLSDFRENAKDYLKEGFKTAAMFMRGKTGLVGTIATHALDEWKPSDQKHQLIDLTLGASKGAALTYIFRKTAMVDPAIKFLPNALNVPLQAAKLGLYTRIPSVGLSRSTWLDENDKFDGARTGNILIANTASIGTDIAAGVATHGLLIGANRITGNAVYKSPMLSTVLTGSGYGMSNGAATEILRQQDNHQTFDLRNFDYGKILQSAVIQGAVDSVAAIPGGYQGEREALRQFNRLNAGSEKTNKVPSFTNDRKSSRKTDGKSKGSDELDTCSMCINGDDLDRIVIAPTKEESTLHKHARLYKQYPQKRFKFSYNEKTDSVYQHTEDFMVYEARQHKTKIGVPAKYSRILDKVREQRIADESGENLNFEKDFPEQKLALAALEMHNRALPEDFIPHLDAQPNSTLIKTIYLLNEKCAQQLKEGRGEYGWALADANKQGHLNYYLTTRDSYKLRETTNHEVGHLVHYRLKDAMDAYHSSCVLDKALIDDTVNHSDYAMKNPFENFAEHWKVLTNPSPTELLKAANYAPVRMAILAKALKSILTEIPQAEVSLHREQYLERIKLIEEKLTPYVVRTLMSKLGQDGSLIDHQLKILSYLDKPVDAATLIKLAKNETNLDRMKSIIEIGVHMFDGKPKERVAFLTKIADSTTNNLAREAAIGKLDINEITLLAEGCRRNKFKDLRRLNDIARWYESEFDHTQSELFARRALIMAYTKNSGLHPETIQALDILTDSLLSQGEYNKAESCMRKSVELSKKIYGEQNVETKNSLERLSTFLYGEGRELEALPFLVRCLQINKNQKAPANHETINSWAIRKGQLEDIISIYETAELPSRGLIFWLRQLDKHLHESGEFLLQREVVDKLLSLLPASQCGNLVNKAVYLDKVIKMMHPEEVTSDAI